MSAANGTPRKKPNTIFEPLEGENNFILTSIPPSTIIRKNTFRGELMPASYAHLTVHIVFSTHNHKTWLKT